MRNSFAGLPLKLFSLVEQKHKETGIMLLAVSYSILTPYFNFIQNGACVSSNFPKQFVHIHKY